MGVSITEAYGDQDTKALYEFLGVQRYTAKFIVADTTAKYDVVFVMRSIWKDSTSTRDTLWNSIPWKARVGDAFRWKPGMGASFIEQTVDSTHVKVKCQFGISTSSRMLSIPANASYSLADGIRYFDKPIDLPMGKPFPLLVLTQPYPDPPPPAKAVLMRYCFGADVPPEDWPKTFGVPHLILFEMTVMP